MTSVPSRSGSRRGGDAAGFTLLSVLIAVAVMAGFVAAYGRHVVVSGRGGMAAPGLLASREACHSGLALARQAILSGEDLVAGSLPAGNGQVVISVGETAGGNRLVSVEAPGSDGLGARRTLELAVQPSPSSAPSGPASLPRLGPAAVDALLDGGIVLHHVTSSQLIAGSELNGLLVVHPGVELQLDDVVLFGAVVSSSVFDPAAYGIFDAALAPRLVVNGNLRIDPPSALPGLAILMPDGSVSSGATEARIQIHGDVVAHDVSLLHEGVLSGQVLGVEVELAGGVSLDRVGGDRKAPDWSPALALGGASEPVFLALVSPSVSLDSLAPIIGYWGN